MSSWIQFQEKYRNSVLQIKVVHTLLNPMKPYQSFMDKSSSGSGFFINAENGLLLTNAHVVDNSVSILGRIPKLSKINLRLKLIKYCKDKDVALCQIYKDDLDIVKDKIGDLSSLNIPFGDNFELRETDEVMAVGYPLGEEEIKFTNGTVSGFFPNVKSKNDEESDLTISEDTPSYIQITASINPGNSGGCLLNKKGEIVGINSAGYMFYQNIAYAIGTRTIISIMSGLFESLKNNLNPTLLGNNSALIPTGSDVLLKLPKLSFDWCPTNKTLLKSLVSSDIEGIYITKVYEDSCLTELQEGDIITSIIIDVTPYHNLMNIKEKIISCNFDNWGTLIVDGFNRNITLKEIMDIIPIDSNIKLKLWRNNIEYLMETKYTRVNVQPLVYKSFRFEILDYEIIAGLCVTPLTLNHIDYDSKLLKYSEGKNRYVNKLLIVNIFPDTEANKTKCLEKGMFIKQINDTKTETIEDLRNAIRNNKNETLYIYANKNIIFAINVKQMILEDKAIIQNFEINHKYIFE
jgi:S1-C subfamily serine protease